MKLKYLLGLFFILILNKLSAQTSEPLLALKSNDFKKAKYLIDSLTEMQVYDNNAEVLFANGLIYESIYFSKDSAVNRLTKSPLLVAGESFLKASLVKPQTKFTLAATKRLDTAITQNLLFEGKKLENLKRIDDAVNHFELYTKLKPNDTTGWLNLAIAAEKGNQLDLAAKSYRQLITLNKKTVFIYKSLTLILKDQKKYFDAQKILKEAFLNLKKDEDWWRIEISLDLDLNKETDALRKLDSTAKLYPQNKKLYLFNIAAIYDAKSFPDSAIKYYQLSLTEDNNYFESNYNLGGIYYQRAKLIYSKINEMPYAEYQKNGKAKEEEGHKLARLALPFFENCYATKKDEKLKELLRDIYFNLKLTDKLKDLNKSN